MSLEKFLFIFTTTLKCNYFIFRKIILPELFFPSANQPERKIKYVQKDSHQQRHSPCAGMCEGVDEPVADVVQQLERRGEDVPTVPTQIAPDIDAENCPQTAAPPKWRLPSTA